MSAFTWFHVALSLVGIFAGFIAVLGLLGSKVSQPWTVIFLWSTLATVVTGFMFPFKGFTPAIGFGVISMPVLGAAFYALHARKLAGNWRWIYGVNAVLALYLNFFVLIVQSFLHVPALHALAPTQKEPPFAIAQGAALLVFVALGVFTTIKFRPPSRLVV
jgi:hypothetical protein